jgi:hypothetical protein
MRRRGTRSTCLCRADERATLHGRYPRQTRPSVGGSGAMRRASSKTGVLCRQPQATA